MPGVEIPRQFQCPTCNEIYPSYNDLLSHLAVSHYKQELLKMFISGDTSCRDCGEAFLTSDEEKLVPVL
jgi:hypothetical protein